MEDVMTLSKEMLAEMGTDLVYVVRRPGIEDRDIGELVGCGLAQRFGNFDRLIEQKFLAVVPSSAIERDGRACHECRRTFESAVAVTKHHAKRHSARALAEVERQRLRDEADRRGEAESRRIYGVENSTCPCCGSAKPPGHAFVVKPEEWPSVTGRRPWGATAAPLAHTISALGPDDGPRAA